MRVSTVHGAKGLEAPIVILADAGPHGQAPRGRLLWGTPELLDGTAELPFWRPTAADREPLTAELVETEQRLEGEENRRLLYVALTRAAERLIVTGWHNRRTGDAVARGTESAELAGSWHAIVRRALERLPGVERVEPHGLGEAFSGPILRFRRGSPASPTEQPLIEAAREPLPDWLARPAAAEPRPPRPLAPSRVLPEPQPPGPQAGAEAGRRRRFGTLVHRSLELLPALSPTDRPAALDRFLARFASDLDAGDAHRLRTTVLGLLDRPDLAPLFGPDALAEQAIVGLVGDVPVSGQIDRLLVTPEEVVAIDFKTGRRPTTTPESYLRQMALYHALLVQRFPERRVRCGLLWAETGEVAWLDAALLAGAQPPPP